MAGFELDFEVFNKYGRQIKEYFRLPDELRKALPAIEKLKSDLDGVPTSFGSARPQNSSTRPALRRKRNRRSGVRVNWTEVTNTGGTKKDLIRSRFAEIVERDGLLYEQEAKQLAKELGCTTSAVRAQYQLWSYDNGLTGKPSRRRRPARG
jgi:hypothetical protein